MTREPAVPTGRPRAAAERLGGHREPRTAPEGRASTTEESSRTVPGMGWLRPGRMVRVCRGEGVYYHGVVEVVMPQAMVLWIRETGLGSRKMIDLQEYVLRPC